MSRGTPDTAALILDFMYGAFTLFGRLSQNRSTILKVTYAVHYPVINHGLGSSAFARHYLRNRFFFLFLGVLRCFSSPRSLRMTIDSSYVDRGALCRVSPFGHPRIIGYLPLPAAFRSLSRPSSALGAKASALRSL